MNGKRLATKKGGPSHLSVSKKYLLPLFFGEGTPSVVGGKPAGFDDSQRGCEPSDNSRDLLDSMR